MRATEALRSHAEEETHGSGTGIRTWARFSPPVVLVMGLGLTRLVLLRVWEYRRSWKCASSRRPRSFPHRRAVKDMATWLVPVTHTPSCRMGDR